MLLYLDNAVSVGPNSRAGLRRERGLNENFARELLELHTLGVNGGYSQDDVRELAKILTGWTVPPRTARVVPVQSVGSEHDAFRFVPNVHEPGDKQLLGRTIRESGEREGLEALLLLSQTPATAISSPPNWSGIRRRHAAAVGGAGDRQSVSRHRRRSRGGC